MRYLFIILIFSSSFAASADSPDLNKLLELKVGDDTGQLANSFKSEKFNYDLVTMDQKLVSLEIYFDKFKSAEKYVKKQQKGFCFAQPARGDFILYRYLFFDKNLQKRYEVTPDLKIKAITIQDFSEANKHRACRFSEVVKLKDQNEVRKLK